jgi:hypothetical protein
MKQNLRTNDSAAGRLFGQLAADKKKTVVAFGLIGVMVFMWVRVLMRKSPGSVEAATGARQVSGEPTEQDSEVQISFVELPKTPGRNDMLTRDFFDPEGWRHFRDSQGRSPGAVQVNIVSKNGSDQMARRIAAKLRLIAIWTQDNPQAFINDTSLSAGEKLTVKDGDNTYECEVTAIEENTVHLRCGEAEIELKLIR